MVYRDEPGASSSGGGGGGEYRDDPSTPSSFAPVEEEYGIQPLSAPVQSRSRGRCCKTLLCASLLAALAVGGYEYYGYSQGQGSGSKGHDVHKPLLAGGKAGVRGKSNPDAGIDAGAGAGSGAEGSPGGGYTPQQPTGGGGGGGYSPQQPSYSYGAPQQPAYGAPQQQQQQQQQQQPNDSSACQDDPTYVVPGRNKPCSTWVASVGKPTLRAGRCNQNSGRMDSSGQQLLVRDFCRASCGNCDGTVGDPNQMGGPGETGGKWPGAGGGDGGGFIQHNSDPKVPLAGIQPQQPQQPPEQSTVAQQPPNEEGGCHDDPAYVMKCARPDLCENTTGEKDETGKPILLKEFCKRSCGLCDEDDGEAPSIAEKIAEEEEEKIDFIEELEEEIEEEEEAEAEEEGEEPEEPKWKPTPGKCEDDPDFVHTNLKTCRTFVAAVGRKPLKAARCGQPTGIKDVNGETLLLKDFCRKSCDWCEAEIAEVAKEAEEGDGYVGELEELKELGEVPGEEEEEEEDAQAGEDGELEEEIVEEEDTDLWEDLKEEANEEEEGQSILFGGGSGSGGGEEEEEEEQEASGEGVGEVSVPNPNPEGVPGPNPEGEDEETEEEKEEEKEMEDEEFEEEYSTSAAPDYFVPLTPVQRDALKERLRATLGLTKNTLVRVSAEGSLTEEMKANFDLKSQRTLVLDQDRPKLFMHLCHGGAEGNVDELISCALERQKEIQGSEIKYSEINEGENLDTCMNDLAERMDATVVDGDFFHNDADGNPMTNTNPFLPEDFPAEEEALDACDSSTAGVMSFGSSLTNVRHFGWNRVESIAVFANPVEHTHSMYQMTSKSCYDCRDFSKVLSEIHDGTFESDDELCASQMIGHQAAHLLTNPRLRKVASDVTFPMEEEIVKEAVNNLRERITWIGILEEMDDSFAGFRTVFPWLAVNLNGEAAMLQQEFMKRGDRIGEDTRFGLPENFVDQKSCMPSYDRDESQECGSKEVDGEALIWIAKLNMRDLAVYKAAVERFGIQKEVLEEYRQALHLPKDNGGSG